MAYYRDLREHMDALDKAGKLQRIASPVNKDTEAHAIVRLQYRGLPESERKAFLFTNVVDSKGKHYDMPLAVSTIAASREVYAIGMQCQPDEIADRWVQAQLHPIPPCIASSGVCQEVVRMGDDLRQPGAGLDGLPIPISTPGFDSAPFLTAAQWVSRDPDTGVYNVGTYRGHVKAPLRTGARAGHPLGGGQDLARHWRRCRELGKPLEVAAVIGGTPNIQFVGVTKLPPNADEYAIAGGLAGEPVELVKCKSVDLAVPATAEIVIEGYIPIDELEPEAPFGEFTGYMNPRELALFMNVTCITHRQDPIYQSFISQFPPSESSKIRQIGLETVIYKYLKHDCGIQGLLEVALQESSGSLGYWVLRMKKTDPGEPMRAFEAVANFRRRMGKIVVAVDEDIDPRDADSVNWALSFRMKPHSDSKVFEVLTDMELDPSLAATSEGEEGQTKAEHGPQTSVLMMDATIKAPFPPTSLPRKPYMERALELWQREGLPKLQLKEPWYGYELGYWSQEQREEAELAVRGDYFATGEKLAGRRRKV